MPSWSPDGSHIAFTLTTERTAAIWSIGVDGSDPRNLSNDPRAGTTLVSGGDAWSRDGRIVYVRGEEPPVDADPLVREDLATAALLIAAVLLALVAIVTVRLEPPFGSFAVILGSNGNPLDDQRRLALPSAAIVGGLIVDVLVRISPDRWKAVAAGAGSAAALVVGAAATVAVTAGLGWTLTLFSGVLTAAIALAWLLAEPIGPRRAMRTEPAR